MKIRISGVLMEDVLLTLYNKANYQGSTDVLVRNYLQKYTVSGTMSAEQRDELAETLRWYGSQSVPGDIEKVKAELTERRNANPPDYHFKKVDFGGTPRELMISFSGQSLDEIDVTEYDELHAPEDEENYAFNILLKEYDIEQQDNHVIRIISRPPTPTPTSLFFTPLVSHPNAAIINNGNKNPQPR